MIAVHGRNAQLTDGQSRVEEMAELREAAPALSNAKILKVLGGIGALIVYLRSFKDSGAVLAETANAMPEPAEAFIPPLNEVAHAQLESEERALSRVPEEPALTGSEGFRPTGSPAAIKPYETPAGLNISGAANGGDALFANRSLPEPLNTAPLNTAPRDPEPQVAGPPGTASLNSAPQESAPEEPAPQETEPQEPAPQEPAPQNPDSAEVCEMSDNLATGEECGTAVDTCAPDQFCDSQDDAGASAEPGCDADRQVVDIARVALHGTDGNDRLVGSDIAEEILPGGGDDQVDAGNGEDIVMGGEGNDHIDGGGAVDLLMGEAGDDVLAGGAGDDLILGGAGADTLLAGSGNDRLDGGAGADVLRDGSGADVLLGSGGDDMFHLLADDSGDLLDGGEGHDTLFLGGAVSRTRIDFAAGTVEIDDGPADRFQRIEQIVAGDAMDAFDFTGLTRQDVMRDAPGFFQITDFGAGDTLRLGQDLVLDFADLLDGDRWQRTEEPDDLQMRMTSANPESADDVPLRLSFRSGEDDRLLTRSVAFDVDQDGTTDFNLDVVIPHGDQHDQDFHL